MGALAGIGWQQGHASASPADGIKGRAGLGAYCHDARLYPLHRRRVHDADPARRRAREFSLARLCARAAGGIRRRRRSKANLSVRPCCHRLTLNPLAILLALAFWAWLWGPMGAFLAVPLTIVILVTMTHLFPPDESKLPD